MFQTRKRKIVSNIFSQKNVLEFEPYLRSAIALLLKRWDDMYTTAVIKKQPMDTLNVYGKDGRVWFDCLDWYNFLAFDIIGDLAFGSPFGMLKAGRDSAPVAVGDKIQYLPAVEILNYRGTYSASLGVVPPWARSVLFRVLSRNLSTGTHVVHRPYVKKIPWYSKGNEAVKNLAGVRSHHLPPNA